MFLQMICHAGTADSRCNCWSPPSRSHPHCDSNTSDDPAHACGPDLKCNKIMFKCLVPPLQFQHLHFIAGDPAHACGPGLKCHKILFKCINDPPVENQICDSDTPCAKGFSCDTTINRERSVDSMLCALNGTAALCCVWVC